MLIGDNAFRHMESQHNDGLRSDARNFRNSTNGVVEKEGIIDQRIAKDLGKPHTTANASDLV